MSDYQITAYDSIIRKSDGADFSPDPANRDYAEYLMWVKNGGAADPYVPPPLPVPEAASKLGLIRAFREMGIWPSVKAAIAANENTQEDWDAAIEIRRTDPITRGMIAALKMTDAQVDALLVRANELVA